MANLFEQAQAALDLAQKKAAAKDKAQDAYTKATAEHTEAVQALSAIREQLNDLLGDVGASRVRMG